MMRALCVLESYRKLGGTGGEPRARFIAGNGLGLIWIHYLRYPDDRDGDGDPRTRTEIATEPGDSVDLPADIVNAVADCSATTCTAAQHRYRFGFTAAPDGGLVIDSLEVRSLPPASAP